ncbi:MAG: ATP-binding protein [Desulfurococcaceae archaeon]|nr:ATP-binding protein [Desulfurococcaceae archaeon]
MSTLQEVLARIINTMKLFRTPLGVKFIDRDFEVKKIINESEKTIFSGVINVLYGSKGCDKTTFLKLFQFATNSEDIGIDVLCIAGEY